MGCFVSKDKLTKEDMDFLKTNTSYDETTIKEWYKGFKVIVHTLLCIYKNKLSRVFCPHFSRFVRVGTGVIFVNKTIQNYSCDVNECTFDIDFTATTSKQKKITEHTSE